MYTYNNVALTIISIILFVYILLGAVLFFSQRSMIYFPSTQDFDSCSGFSEYEKVRYNGTRMYVKNQSPDVIIYYHGNAGSACDRSITSSVFEETGSSVIYVEYAGYSNDPQPPSRERILNDVRNVQAFTAEKGYDRVTVYGQSIGSGPASYHASLGNVDTVILVTPFARLSDVAQSQFPMYPVGLLLQEDYDNVSWLSEYDGDVIILHGDQDEVIADRFSRDLYEELQTGKKEYLRIEGVGHNDMWSSASFRNTLSDLLQDD
jgi:hypothetical protein